MIIKRLYRPLIIAALGAATIPMLAQAQYTPGSFMYFDHVANAGWVNLGINPAVDDLKSDSDKDRVEEPPRDLLKFSVSLPKRKAMIQTMVDTAAQKNPAGGQMLKAVIQDQDIFRILQSALKESGYQMDDLGDPLGFYWVASWSVANDKVGVNSRPQMLAVRDQAAGKLRTMPSIIAMSDEGKQALAETLYLNALVLVIQHKLSAQIPFRKADAEQSARQGGTMFGMDLSKYRLTESGFQPI